MSRIYAAAAITMMASAAQAVTITNDQLTFGQAYDLVPSQFTTLSTEFDPGPSVTTSLGEPADGRSFILKNIADAVPDGRFSLDPGRDTWLDSADIGLVRWDLEFLRPTRAFGFGVTGAADRPRPLFPVPFWRLIVDGVVAEAAAGGATEAVPGGVTWWTILFDDPVSTASLTIVTAPGDGYGISAPIVAPVPLPPAALLMLASLVGLFGVRHWRRRHVAA